MTKSFQYYVLFLSFGILSLSTKAFSFTSISPSRGSKSLAPRQGFLQARARYDHLTTMPQRQRQQNKQPRRHHQKKPKPPFELNLFYPTSRTSHKVGLQRRLSHEDENDFEKPEERPKVDALVELVSLRMKRVSFLSWWAQVILTTVAGVTLLFTRNVLNLESNPANKAALLPNYFVAGGSISLSLISIFWTWATRRLSRRLLRKPTTRIQAANMLRKDITVGTCLNLMGMAFAIFGAEQIIGGLAVKVLTTSTSAPAIYQSAQAASLLQPLDILVVQANTNTLFSHFCSIVAYLFLGRSIGQLDPPSYESDERPRA